MPCSGHQAITLVLEHVRRVKPRSVLDIGPGYGKWGFLIRETLDFMEGRYRRDSWGVRILGIDAFPSESPLLDWVYDDVRTADVLDAPRDLLSGHDLVVMGDVIEHLEKTAGQALLQQLVSDNGCVIVVTPKDFFAQETVEGNPFEQHRSLWTVNDFTAFDSDVDIYAGTVTAAIRGATGTYPSRGAVRASRAVRRLPMIRGRGMAARLAKTGLRRFLRLH